MNDLQGIIFILSLLICSVGLAGGQIASQIEKAADRIVKAIHEAEGRQTEEDE